ncbi:MAG: hypothetical protein COU46_01575 [Candidatus Niyogibacteria bacterium CG10_big_fil_rev_8_21_14_0_10_42_19]|uniref:DNA polymerase III subunit delta n=1 Tax=Candidatus Niyogibacteria bacterium CG10_big_fil_rev_8_21_14_0_10_42_19 TaxID=1974725 RepID=A0A2H0TFT6_9BACT|nr:MAG: hypothetical protein COU46_01575 [Candidatus Niyogibacteria bacterium CG10_big_fil_rev_8_21_14_0_10_42_19]
MIDLLNKYLKEKVPAHGYFILGLTEYDPIIKSIKNFNGEMINIGSDRNIEGIDIARKIKKRAHFASSRLSPQMFVINAASLTREARSALLKIVEDPPAFTYFIFYADSREALDSTFRSRLIEITASSKTSSTSQDMADLAQNFLKADMVGREELLTVLADSSGLSSLASALEEKVLTSDDNSGLRGETLQILWNLRSLIKKPAVPASIIKDYLVYFIPLQGGDI